jgi:hypothetical protein
MDERAIEKLLKPGRSRYRPQVWQTLGQYSIDPPQRFCVVDVFNNIIRSKADHIYVPLTTISVELRKLEKIDMVLGVEPDGPQDRANWFVRTDPAAWQHAIEFINQAEQPS